MAGIEQRNMPRAETAADRVSDDDTAEYLARANHVNSSGWIAVHSVGCAQECACTPTMIEFGGRA